ncbi:Crp/Fnr family transcriptional regulator [Nostocoides sp. HKS02]|uniref:Crp/Fnr family transcriptional regulator n=1 Tax=Nostocoides sp. HKS02 TaxID=1813880 RepID=UPI0012B47187|nr:Crp/Fnr family transcriptional regulator [Tetrasphaera sp. HKS02]QGN57774.1 cyclic nucleotide-binding domain-containing protein [Tetrasphaera sp. HKS02]
MEPDLLSGLPEPERTRVAELMVRRYFSRGESLFHEGDAADCVHFLVEGHVLVRRTTPAGDRAAFTVMGPGEACGELALLSPDARRTSSVQALEPVVTLVLDARAFTALTVQRPEVNRLLVDLLAARVRRLSDHLVDALYASVEQRVVRRLVDLCAIYGVERGEAVLPLTQSDLADLAGASRPATNRVLRGLADQGLVVLARGRMRLPDVAAVRAVAG